MYLSNFYLPILKQTGDGLISYKYSVRAGLVRQLTSGIYSWLPLGVRVLEKIQRIIHAEMEKIGAIEIFSLQISGLNLDVMIVTAKKC